MARLTVAESGAIVEYLVDTYGDGRLAPARGTPERLRYTYWLHYAEGSAMPPLLLKLVFDRMAKNHRCRSSPSPSRARCAGRAKDGFIEPQIALHLDYLESELGKNTWFAGADFSAADIQMSFPLKRPPQGAGLDASRPTLMDFLARIHARPAYKRALEKGGPYSVGR